MEEVNDYKLFKSLGKGSFGEVYLTQKKNNPKLFAMKKIPIKKLKNEKDEFSKYLENEINIMQQLNHENIIKLYEKIEKPDYMYLVMDYINGGSLLNYLTKYKLLHGSPFPQKMIQYFVKQIVQGLIYIHSKNIIHRDIKLENILLHYPPNIKKENRDYTHAQIKIIDFGLSTQIKINGKFGAKSVVGSPIYMDPIILQKYKKAGGLKKFKFYDEKADIWSLGAITYEMLTGENLFKAKNLPELMNKVEKGNYFLEVKELSSEIISFLNSMLQYDPDKRLSSVELAKHQFLVTNPEHFHKADISRIEKKVDDKGILTINIFNNSTIQGLFPFKPGQLCTSLNMNLHKINEENEEIESKPKEEKNKEYKVKFEVQRIDNIRENINFNLYFLVKENHIMQHSVNLKIENNLHDEWIWNIDDNDWRNIDINNENFLITIELNNASNKNKVLFNAEVIKLGKPIFFTAKNFIKFTLTPLKEK